MSAALLEIEGLSVRYPAPGGDVAAVNDFCLTLAAGECVGIVGESGAGKSQALLAAMGLLPRHARVAGAVRYRGEPFATDLRGRRVAMIFQDPMTSLTPHMRVGTQIAESLTHHLGVSSADARVRALALLQQVQVTDAERRLDQYPHELSGGMRQRVMIAIALACNPDVLIADEPTTALDVTVQAQILALLAALKRERGMAVVIVTHDLGVVAGVADRVAVMYGGRIVELGTVDQVLKSPQHPYTRALLASMPRLDAPETARLQAIAGQPPNPRSLPAGCAFHPRCDLATELCGRQRPELANSWPRVACHHAQVSTNTAGSDS